MVYFAWIMLPIFQRDSYLNSLARSSANLIIFRNAASQLVPPLTKLKTLQIPFSAEVFEELDPDEIANEAENLMIQVR